MNYESEINTVFASMTAESNRLNLPIVYKDDLKVDLETLTRFADKGIKQFLWQLREGGSVLIPVGLGVNPVYVSFWHNAGYPTSPYLISIDDGKSSIEPISIEKMLNIVHRKPHGQVEDIIKRGCDLNIWGLWNTPSFESFSVAGWLDYFQYAGNKLMVDLIKQHLH